MLVDDDEAILKMLSSTLAEEGIDVLTADSGKAAIDSFNEADDIAVIVTDLIMPGMDGLELMEAVKNLDQYVEVIVMTGYGTLESSMQALKMGAYEYINKPIDTTSLIHSINRAIERSNLYKERDNKKKELETLVQKLEQRNNDLKKTLRSLKRANTQLIQTDKLSSLGQLAAGLAHEINNPIGFVHANLNTMSKYSQKIQKFLKFVREKSNMNDNIDFSDQIIKKWDTEKIDIILSDYDDVIEESIGGTKRVKNIIEDLRTFSRSSVEKMKKCDLMEGLESTLNILKGSMKHKTEIVRKYNDIPSVVCTPHQINQVFLNLLQNSLQAIEKSPGKIIVRTRAISNNRITIDVEDNGKGIEPKVLKRIFDPFYTSKESGKGVGLGLSISYRIIKEHGGEIRASSTPGKGTKFQIVLPVNGPESSKAGK